LTLLAHAENIPRANVHRTCPGYIVYLTVIHAVFIEQISEAICDTLMGEMRFPLGDTDRQRVAALFKKDSGLPFVLGAIDGTHFRIRNPDVKQANYRELKGLDPDPSTAEEVEISYRAFFSRYYCFTVSICAIAAPNLEFLWVGGPYPGAAADNNVFENGVFAERIQQLVPHPYYIIGDSAYASTPQVVPMYKGTKHEHADNQVFIRLHVLARNCVERGTNNIYMKVCLLFIVSCMRSYLVAKIRRWLPIKEWIHENCV